MEQTRKYPIGEHPELPAPIKTTGIVAWVKQNLFNGVFNSILTVIFCLIAFFTIKAILGWAVFSATVYGDTRFNNFDVARRLSGEASHVVHVTPLPENFFDLTKEDKLSFQKENSGFLSGDVVWAIPDDVVKYSSVMETVNKSVNKTLRVRTDRLNPDFLEALVPGSGAKAKELEDVYVSEREAKAIRDAKLSLLKSKITRAKTALSKIKGGSEDLLAKREKVEKTLEQATTTYETANSESAAKNPAYVQATDEYFSYVAEQYSSDLGINTRKAAIDTAMAAKDLPALNTALHNMTPIVDWAGDNNGAAWALVKRRGNQFLMGYYPRSEQWRVWLTFALLLVALVPILFNSLKISSTLIWFTMLYPVVATYLLSGLSLSKYWIFGPYVALTNLFSAENGAVYILMLMLYLALFAALSYLLFRLIKGLLSSLASKTIPLVGVLTLGFLMIFLYINFFFTGSKTNGIPIPIANEFLSYVSEDSKWGGAMLTIVIGIVGIVCSLPIGVVLALGRRSNMPLVKIICVGFIELIRSVPLITVLFMASNMLPLFLPEGVSFGKLLRILIGVTLFSSAYMAEVVRGGLQALPKGQYEGAAANGLTYWPMMYLVVLPQALKIVIPGIVNTFIGLFKDTTLVIIVGLYDIVLMAQTATSDPAWKALDREGYFFVAVFFFIFCFSMSRYSIYLEGRLNTGHRN